MPKSSAPPSLNLNSNTSQIEVSRALSPATLSPRSSRSPRSNPTSPFMEQGQEFDAGRNGTEVSSDPNGANHGALSPSLTAIPQYPPSPMKASPKHTRGTSHGFFSNLMASKSSHRLQPMEPSPAEPVERERTPTNRPSRASSKDRVLYYSSAKGSATDLRKNQRDHSADRGMSGSDTSLHQSEGAHALGGPAKKGKQRFGLLRQRSLRAEEQSKLKPSTPQNLDLDQPPPRTDRDPQYSEPMKTAPLRNDHRERTLGDSTHRNRSADRPQVKAERSQEAYPPRHNKPGGSLVNSSSFKDNAGTFLLSNLQSTGRGAADKLGKAGKGIFGRIARSGSSHEREVVTDDNYICSTINMPLVKQTRRTRIARRLEHSNDKTEFWMPALPWRCIDYLNMNGCEEEGLYRIPGSNKDVKHWQRRFDTEHDINLVDEPELYDINTIGSMFKAWLRDLPDEIFPKTSQVKIAEQCMGASKAPQVLRDELSRLPPFNYYLLFAITCHLSLLHSFADKNKMNYGNLCICFQPSLRIDGFCFQFLVQDWKNCWQGCWTENEYLEEEYRVQAEADESESQSVVNEGEDRATPSAENNQHHHNTTTMAAPTQRVPNLVRKEGQNGAGRPPVVPKRAPDSKDSGITSSGNGNLKKPVSNQTGATSTNNESSSTIREVQAEGEGNRMKVHSKSGSSLPALNRLSPIKL